ncbi:MAG: putative cysteine desulfurase [Betaproteobacteria bacterium ADurb.Bin341]|nr:MAG: putative cysteine desulfurase [Betaproteobacteria bacterium ADurb.Bin341]
MTAPSLLYLDNAATSWPKPPVVAEAMLRFMEQVGANPGRSGHRLSIEAGRLVESARESVCSLFNAPDPLRVVFGANVTEALNLVLYGLLRPGDHVITTSMEHNAMMRPLRHLEREGVELTVLPCRADGTLDIGLLQPAIRKNTVLIAMMHASNVAGTLLPVAEAGRIARQHGLLLLVDSAATAGAVPIDMEACAIDLLAFTGHKSLFGPTGTGGLIIGERVDPNRIRPLMRGGTGSRSEYEEQPEFLPDRFESGTLNVVGLAGLNAGIDWILERGVVALQAELREKTQALIDGLKDIPGVQVHGTHDARWQTACVSFNVEGLSSSEAGFRLDEEFGIQVRIGLHCAPAAHRTLGTFPAGSIRFAPGLFTSRAEIEQAVAAVRSLAR